MKLLRLRHAGRLPLREPGIEREPPALDIPVQPKTLMVPAAGTIELVTPVRLRLRAGVPTAQDRLVWSIPHEPKGVQLTFTLDLPPPFDQPFTTQVAPE